jgi:hypothetical protein
MNRDLTVDPIHYLEMMFGRFMNDSQLLEHKKMNYLAFVEIVVAFTACGVFKDIDQYHKACFMQERLKQLLDI